MAGLKGLHDVMANLGAEIGRIEGPVTESALLEGGLFVQSQAQPITPRDTGNLRNSAYTQSVGSKGKPVVEVGYTADYAGYVHEKEIYNPSEPGTENKFLLKAVQRNQKRIVKIVANNIKRKAK